MRCKSHISSFKTSCSDNKKTKHRKCRLIYERRWEVTERYHSRTVGRCSCSCSPALIRGVMSFALCISQEICSRQTR
ncbi:hypothetical protein Mp_3g08990 [Marchantia polymorpha subsp. ruderalis]|uniref:Uncharacterized protein n=2 Tax=Marchantia polymorpha TaxID=3197 RepID=A0AAF6AYW0_MARPO|nr:hypothetical protein MARPO_0105s0018 [Marchantia polymorpha]BBN04944.1 hypothetical protein Mp_3g08990 [Marchantia polymorpha subsp. ruderalis]|eukprot:PTQ31899.1 hypothetical protein MARPO_0105s0018 [Marchantia polymorpha]